VSDGALVLTYHAVERGPAPLCVEPGLFREHLAVLAGLGATTLTVSELARGLRQGRLPRRAVAITFDDGFRSVVREAAPALAERGFKATVFCVAGHLGGVNDWNTQRPDAPRSHLAGPGELAELAAAGIEVGSHGVEHAPLDRAGPELAERELAESKARLADAVGLPVTSFAYPYAIVPSGPVRERAGELYEAACVGGMARAVPTSDPLAIPRVDSHYLRRPALLGRAVEGSLGPYMTVRRLGARARRLLVKDYTAAAP
jgi:peptidoglycan/xylan/chitin deacetylase (PgdA/CDA1 family)